MKLCQEVIDLRGQGHRVVIVTSGAVAAGVAAIGLASRPTDVPTLQALSAAGQSRLMQVYNDILGHYGAVGAQVLLTPYDFINRRQYLHARQTLERLLELGCVPVVNENDAIAVDEIRFGDNDRIAALVSHLLSADLLVLLTDTDGLYTSDPRIDPQAALIDEVTADDPLAFMATASGTGSERGSGGMASKLEAARMASWSGVRVVIARASRPRVLADALAGAAGIGTVFRSHDRRLPARKLWIAFASGSYGTIAVDDGAAPGPRRAQRLAPAGRGARRQRRVRGRRPRRRGRAGRPGLRSGHGGGGRGDPARGGRPAHVRPARRGAHRGHPPRRPGGAAGLARRWTAAGPDVQPPSTSSSGAPAGMAVGVAAACSSSGVGAGARPISTFIALSRALASALAVAASISCIRESTDVLDSSAMPLAFA